MRPLLWDSDEIDPLDRPEIHLGLAEPEHHLERHPGIRRSRLHPPLKGSTKCPFRALHHRIEDRQLHPPLKGSTKCPSLYSPHVPLFTPSKASARCYPTKLSPIKVLTKHTFLFLINVRPQCRDQAMMRFIDRYFIKQPKLRRFVTRLIEGDRTHDVQLLGTTFRLHSIKDHGYLRASRMAASSSLLRDELPVIINLASLFREGDTFVDIGANVGIYSLTLARLHRLLPKTQFYAFEANPDTFARLSIHTAALGIQASNIALSDHDGTLEFVSGAVSHVFTTVENASAYSISSSRVSVPCRRLDKLDISGTSLILKIDVEGQEKNVLDGSLELFQAHRVKAVYLDGYKDRGVESFLTANGFTLLEGKTLEPTTGAVFSLLAIRNDQMAESGGGDGIAPATPPTPPGMRLRTGRFQSDH